MRGPDHHALGGELADGRLLRGLCDPEVGHEHVARAVEQDVVGLYIAVHDAVQVCVAERVRHLPRDAGGDRKSTRLNSSHGYISYAVFCLKKKMITNTLG